MTRDEALLKVEHDGPGKPNSDELVWDQVSSWVWASQCGRFKIERFIPGDHEALGRGFAWPERYRVLKHTPEWYYEASPSELTLAAAKEVCQKLI